MIPNAWAVNENRNLYSFSVYCAKLAIDNDVFIMYLYAQWLIQQKIYYKNQKVGVDNYVENFVGIAEKE